MATKSGNRAEVDVDVEEALTDLEHKVERVKILYEQYFMGIEKIEPQTVRKEIARKIMELTQLQIRNTAMRYRFHALNQKFGAYATYWSRTMREIENGTYFRSVARANRTAAEKGVDVPDEVMRALPKRLRDRILRDRERIAAARARTADGKPQPAAATTPAAPAAAAASTTPAAPAEDGFDQSFEQLFDSLSSLTKSKPKAAPTPSTPTASAPALPLGMDEAKVRDLHRRYVAARRALGDTAEVRYEQILATVQKQGPKIIEQHGARAVEFDVVLKDGKAILKAIPRR
jgi:hypothetical protein